MQKPHPDAFVSSYDFERGYIEWCLLEPLPGEKIRSTIFRSTFTPRRFFDENRDLGDLQQPKASTQDHWRQVARIPHALANQWQEELGNPALDDDARKAWDKRLNSREFHKLRVHDGQL